MLSLNSTWLRWRSRIPSWAQNLLTHHFPPRFLAEGSFSHQPQRETSVIFKALSLFLRCSPPPTLFGQIEGKKGKLKFELGWTWLTLFVHKSPNQTNSLFLFFGFLNAELLWIIRDCESDRGKWLMLQSEWASGARRYPQWTLRNSSTNYSRGRQNLINDASLIYAHPNWIVYLFFCWSHKGWWPNWSPKSRWLLVLKLSWTNFFSFLLSPEGEMGALQLRVHHQHQLTTEDHCTRPLWLLKKLGACRGGLIASSEILFLIIIFFLASIFSSRAFPEREKLWTSRFRAPHISPVGLPLKNIAAFCWLSIPFRGRWDFVEKKNRCSINLWENASLFLSAKTHSSRYSFINSQIVSNLPTVIFFFWTEFLRLFNVCCGFFSCGKKFFGRPLNSVLPGGNRTPLRGQKWSSLRFSGRGIRQQLKHIRGDLCRFWGQINMLI